jgi:hypothetical protein
MSIKPSRLLAAGTSLVGLGGDGKQYREVAPLPKFGANKKGKIQHPTSNLQKSSKIQISNKEGPANGQALRRTGTSSEIQAPNNEVPTSGVHGPGFISRWSARIKGLLPQGRTAKPVAPRFSQPPIQGELSLDNVKVLRNDLSDTDFEVRARPAPAEKKTPPATVASPEQMPERELNRTRIWNRVTTLLGASQS